MNTNTGNGKTYYHGSETGDKSINPIKINWIMSHFLDPKNTIEAIHLHKDMGALMRVIQKAASFPKGSIYREQFDNLFPQEFTFVYFIHGDIDELYKRAAGWIIWYYSHEESKLSTS